MYPIVYKENLNSHVFKMKIGAPRVAKKCAPGQFIILMVNEKGERIPLTIADFNRERGTVTIIFQVVGKTTELLASKNAGDYIKDFTGPLGKATEVEDNIKRVAIVGGGLGCAVAYPQAKALFKSGVTVDIIAGFKTEEIIILESELKRVSNNLYILTDDGSNGNKGLVTDQLRKLIENGNKYDLVMAFGPLPMMKFVSLLTKEYGIKTIVSMNPIMVDGTGMCGSCRLTVGGEIKFACIDGPDFDGHLVDFDEAIKRNSVYNEHRKNEEHKCNLLEMRVADEQKSE